MHHMQCFAGRSQGMCSVVFSTRKSVCLSFVSGSFIGTGRFWFLSTVGVHLPYVQMVSFAFCPRAGSDINQKASFGCQIIC